VLGETNNGNIILFLIRLYLRDLKREREKREKVGEGRGGEMRGLSVAQ
jgi:hypothetical protein